MNILNELHNLRFTLQYPQLKYILETYEYNPILLAKNNYNDIAVKLLSFKVNQCKQYILTESIDKQVLNDPVMVKKLNSIKFNNDELKEFKEWVKKVKKDPLKYINDPDAFADSNLTEKEIKNLKKRAKMSYNSKRQYMWFTTGLPTIGAGLGTVAYGYQKGGFISALYMLLGYGISLGLVYLYKKYKELKQLKNKQNVLTQKHLETAKKLNDDPTFIKYMSGNF